MIVRDFSLCWPNIWFSASDICKMQNDIVATRCLYVNFSSLKKINFIFKDFLKMGLSCKSMNSKKAVSRLVLSEWIQNFQPLFSQHVDTFYSRMNLNQNSIIINALFCINLLINLYLLHKCFHIFILISLM